MPNESYYVVTGESLTQLAEALRILGGTSDPLEWPVGFAQALMNLPIVDVQALNVTQNGTYTAPTGTAYSPVTVSVSGGGGADTLAALEADTLETWTSTAGAVAQYLFYGKTGIKSVSYPNATRVNTYAFYACTNLESINFPNVTAIDSYAFRACGKIVTANLPKVTSLGAHAFYGCSSLTSVTLSPNFSQSGASNLFNGCSSLPLIDLQKCSSIGTSMFTNCAALKTLILRKTGSVCPLSSASYFNNSPFASNGSGGTLYVPNDLIASYQSASNWSTILGYPNNQIKAIEGSIYE